MVAQIPKSVADRLGLDLSAEVARYALALEAHAKTVNKPAPTAHPLVEQIVQAHGGQFEIIDDTPVETAEQARARLNHQAHAEMIARIDALSSPARRQLAQIDLTTLLAKTERSAGEEARLADVQKLFADMNTLARHAALLAVEIEDLTPEELTTWQPHGWPAL